VVDYFIDSPVEVLDATIGQHGWQAVVHAELSVTTFWTFVRELSPPSSHCPRILVDSGGGIGASGFRFEAPVAVFSSRHWGGERKLAGDNLTHRPRRLQFRLGARSSQDSHSCFRFASARTWRAFCRAVLSSSGMRSPVLKYISSGVCPWNAECGSRELCSCT